MADVLSFLYSFYIDCKQILFCNYTGHTFSADSSSGMSIGLSTAAAPARRMVRMMTLKPEEIPAVSGSRPKTQLTAMDTATRPPMKAE